VVIGGSAGGMDALRRILPALPPGLPASVFIVVHIGAVSQLAAVLDRFCPLRVVTAASGMPVHPSCVFVAPPGRHMLLHDQHILLRRGPRENLARPAIDPLFRSAAATFGPRVVGVVLSGALTDGTAGLLAVQRCGGCTIVQQPADAAVPQMPQSALRHLTPDSVAPADAIGPLLARLVGQPAGAAPPVPFEVRLEAAIAAQELDGMPTNAELGTLSPLTCPECQGALWEIEDGTFRRFRCHVGHAFTAETVLAAQAERAEALLYTLLRTHRERAVLTRRIADLERSQSRDHLADEFDRRARDYEEDAEVIRRLLREDSGGSADDEAEQDLL
jgi:two-component system chemotaxis response regulator CheB